MAIFGAKIAPFLAFGFCGKLLLITKDLLALFRKNAYSPLLPRPESLRRTQRKNQGGTARGHPFAIILLAILPGLCGPLSSVTRPPGLRMDCLSEGRQENSSENSEGTERTEGTEKTELREDQPTAGLPLSGLGALC